METGDANGQDRVCQETTKYGGEGERVKAKSYSSLPLHLFLLPAFPLPISLSLSLFVSLFLHLRLLYHLTVALFAHGYCPNPPWVTFDYSQAKSVSLGKVSEPEDDFGTLSQEDPPSGDARLLLSRCRPGSQHDLCSRTDCSGQEFCLAMLRYCSKQLCCRSKGRPLLLCTPRLRFTKGIGNMFLTVRLKDPKNAGRYGVVSCCYFPGAVVVVVVGAVAWSLEFFLSPEGWKVFLLEEGTLADSLWCWECWEGAYMIC